MINSKNLIEGMFEAALIFNKEGIILDLNGSAEAVFDFSRDQLLGKKLSEVSFKYFDEEGIVYNESQNPIFQILNAKKPIKGRKLQVQLVNQKIKWLQLNAVFLKDLETHNLTQIIITFNDISELISVRHEVEVLNEQLLEKVETLNVLTRSFNQAQKLSKMGHWMLESTNDRLVWSDEVFRIFGLEPQSVIPDFELFIGFIHPDDVDLVNDAYQQSLQDKSSYEVKHRIICGDGTQKYVQEKGFHDFDEQGNVLRTIGTVLDITEQHLKAFQVETLVNLVNSQLIMSRTDTHGNILDVSDFFCDISGYHREELIGQNQNIVRHPDMPSSFYKELWQTIQSGKTWVGEIKNLRKDGGYYWVKSRISPDYDPFGNLIGYISLRQDITAQKRLEEIAIKDELTGLYNRRYYNQRLHLEINRAKRDQRWLCFLMLDIDNFKKYNDTYGHQVGDYALKKVASALDNSFNRAGDICFRLGGEEFAVLFEVENPEDGKQMADRVRQAVVDLDIEHSGNPPWLKMTISIGVLLMDPHQNYIEEEVYKYADSALYQAKSNGRNRIECVKESEVELF
ncbi:hypothetical protein CYQ88_01795 [Hydrogenovibrio sp. SC-1]|uniref:sensor domain-containing diguanylate cyclase n=1 Tax=Hydrogenovibrio sp. SC-1 TaxID=2065820 RepID=UPI000C7CB92C|nr:diguanylate cyclase [Hydrogenovibrio sp. SC-1]PLA75324.1 hypothetical protein CYQ88_01795 [Hydrogenovibrio sp. SC-1]